MTTKAMTLETARAALEDQLLEAGSEAIPIHLVASEDDAVLEGLSDAHQSWVEAQGWKPTLGALLLLPNGTGGLRGVLLGTGGKDWAQRTPLLTGALPAALPEGDYRFASPLPDPELAALGFLAGSYRFNRYKTANGAKSRRLVRPDGASRDYVLALTEALYFGRDLINTPANDLGPAELEAAARELANAYGGSIKVTEGSGLLSDNFPMIHAVGRASDRAPRLIDLRFGSEHAPKVTIVGKGICFDTGGLDIKPSSGMALMKKDMGGAASALAFALGHARAAADPSARADSGRREQHLRQRVSAWRRTHEPERHDGRDRQHRRRGAARARRRHQPRRRGGARLSTTVATLTGAARVALGPDLPPLYSNDDDFATGLLAAGRATGDPMWRMPFWAPYDKMLKSPIADVNHIAEGSYAGSVVAALFLKRFVAKAKRFAHLDIFGWVPREQPGRPQGGEPQAARALFQFFRKEFGTS